MHTSVHSQDIHTHTHIHIHIHIATPSENLLALCRPFCPLFPPCHRHFASVLLCLAINFKLGVHTKNIRSFLSIFTRSHTSTLVMCAFPHFPSVCVLGKQMAVKSKNTHLN